MSRINRSIGGKAGGACDGAGRTTDDRSVSGAISCAMACCTVSDNNSRSRAQSTAISNDETPVSAIASSAGPGARRRVLARKANASTGTPANTQTIRNRLRNRKGSMVLP